jgi:hypothetical protein
MFEHFTSVACAISQPLIFTPQKSTFMELMLIFFHCTQNKYRPGRIIGIKMNFLKNSSSPDDIFIQSRRYIIYLGRLGGNYHPSRLNIICCGQLLAMFYAIHLQQTIFNESSWYLSDGDDMHLEQTVFIQWKRYSFKRDKYHLWWLILEITINHWRWYSTTGDDNRSK